MRLLQNGKLTWTQEEKKNDRIVTPDQVNMGENFNNPPVNVRLIRGPVIHNTPSARLKENLRQRFRL